MRILHVSDTHLGFSQYGRLTADGLNQREQDVFVGFRHVIDAALDLRPDVVVHAGDVFDSVRPTNRAIAFCMEQVQRLHAADIPFFVIAGNHETPKLRETGSVLRTLEFLPNVKAVFRGAVETATYGDLTITGVPQAEGQEAYEELLDAATPTDSRWNVLVAHAGVIGVADFKTGEFNELTLGDHRLTPDWDYIALGHYHNPTEVRRNARYAGSTERTSFREAEEEKGFVLVDLAEGTQTFHAIPTRPMVRLKPLDALGMGAMELGVTLADRLKAAEPDGKLVSIKVQNVSRTAYAALDFAQLRKATVGAVHAGIRWEFEEKEGVGGPVAQVGTLADEFDAFLDTVPLDVPRPKVATTGKAILKEAEEATL